MHYIRFLKPPVAKPSSSPKSKKLLIKAVITITTDLGDDFYPADVQLKVLFDRVNTVLLEQTTIWQASSRSLTVEAVYAAVLPKTGVRMIVCPATTERIGATSKGGLVTVLSASSPVTFDQEQPPRQVQRSITLPSGRRIIICEELGESIARHVWDAGIALAALLDPLGVQSINDLPLLSKRLTLNRRVNVIELGTGCGLVAASLASIVPGVRVMATDLPEAKDTALQTFTQNKVGDNSEVDFQVLDWNVPLPSSISQERYDVVLAADCTYNPDSSLALVSTIQRLAKHSNDPLVVIAMKVRHLSEAVFFEHMSAAGFVAKEESYVLCPHMTAGDEGGEVERVDVYVFGWKRPE